MHEAGESVGSVTLLELSLICVYPHIFGWYFLSKPVWGDLRGER